MARDFDDDLDAPAAFRDAPADRDDVLLAVLRAVLAAFLLAVLRDVLDVRARDAPLRLDFFWLEAAFITVSVSSWTC